MLRKKQWLYSLALSLLLILGSPLFDAGLLIRNAGASENAIMDDQAGDANQDGFIDQLDLDLVAINFGPQTAGQIHGDINGDQIVDIFDLAVVARNFGKTALQPLRSMRIERAFANLEFTALTNLLQPDDGREMLFVTEKAGLVRVFQNNDNATEAGVFLDIRDSVSDRGMEEGLLGLAFDPAYRDNGFFYTYYSAASPRRSVVSRFSVSDNYPNLADPDDELVIIEIPQPYGNHNGGQLAFGPDGFLYIGLGDGGSGGDPHGHGQDTGSLLGSVLRIDVGGASEGMNYRVPPDNPFVGVPGARDEIWAYGLRNPWRFSFQVVGEQSGTLWLGDVGQNNWEEVDIIQPGLNYGWNLMEGNHCYQSGAECGQTSLALPIIQYPNPQQGCSITGGHVFSGRGMPSLIGAYVYGDFCSGKIWGLRYNGESVTEQALLAESGLLISSFGVDQAGSLYVLSFNEGIYWLVPEE